MIWKITKKELLLNLMTFKFVAGTILCVILMAVFMPVLVNDYQQRLKDYNANVTVTQTELQKAREYYTILFGWRHFIYRPPMILSVFGKGADYQIDNSVRIRVFDVPELSAGSSEVNSYMSILPTLDISLIFKIVVSVLALMVACDVISNEREQGTLKLMLSTSVARYQVLLGKLLAGLITLFIPVTIAFITGLLILQFSVMIDLTDGDWARIGVMYIASLLFVLAMHNIGLLVSCITKRSSASFLLSSLFWMFFIIVVPNVSLHFATLIRPLEPEKITEKYLQEIRERQQKEMQKLRKQIPWRGEIIDIGESLGKFLWICDQKGIEYRQKYYAAIEPLRIKHAEEKWEIKHTTVENLLKQKQFTNTLSWISPISLYDTVVSGLAGTDVYSCQDFIKSSRRYRREVIDYIRLKTDNFSLPCFFTPFDAVDTNILERYNDPATDAEEVQRWKELKRAQAPPINLEDFPAFAWKPSVAGAIIRTIPNLLALIIVSVLLFVLSFIVFLRYDVR